MRPGIVRDPAGLPADACRVSVFGSLGIQDADADEHGRFRVGPLPRADWSVTANINLPAGSAESEPVRAPSGARDLEHHLVLAATIAGRVVSADGTPPAACEVLVRRLDAVRANDELRPVVDGAFQLGHLLPGTFSVSAPPSSYSTSYSWAELLRRVFSVDVLTCPACGSRRRLIALISDPPIVRKILRHLGLTAEPPTLAPPRSPPQMAFGY